MCKIMQNLRNLRNLNCLVTYHHNVVSKLLRRDSCSASVYGDLLMSYTPLTKETAKTAWAKQLIGPP